MERSGWVLFAWTLMSNHYHLLFKTPEANLVRGMTWLQNAWTRRFNARHQLWGHLFGGRYKAIPVQEGDYLARLIYYIHLNPVRAGLVKQTDGLESYPWSSLIDYVVPLRRRRNWVAVDRGLDILELPDTAAGRRQLLTLTEQRVNWQNPGDAGVEISETQSLQSTLRRGWYFGTEAFREMLLERLGPDAGELKKRRRRGYTGDQTRDHGVAEAERIIRNATEVFAVAPDDWALMKKGDWRKGIVAELIQQRALVDNGWLAEHLHLGARNGISRCVRRAQEHIRLRPKDGRLARKFRKLSSSFD